MGVNGIYQTSDLYVAAWHGLPVDNEVRDQVIVDLRQGKDGYDPMGEEEIAQVIGLSRPRSLLGVNIFLKDKAKTTQPSSALMAIQEAALVKLIEGRSRYFDYGNAPFIPIVHLQKAKGESWNTHRL